MELKFSAEGFMVWLTNDVKTLAEKENRIEKLTEEQAKNVLRQIAKMWTNK